MTNRIDRAVYRAGVRSANGSTRRGFLARVGAAGAALGTGGLIAMPPRDAAALCSGTTVTCNELYGFNGCASNLCEDGSWCVSSGCDNIYSGGTRWRDCCIRSWECGCHSAAGKPTCCSGCIYGNACSAANGWVVRCRYHSRC